MEQLFFVVLLLAGNAASFMAGYALARKNHYSRALEVLKELDDRLQAGPYEKLRDWADGVLWTLKQLR